MKITQKGGGKKYYLLEYMSSNESLSSTIGIELTFAAKRERIQVGYQKQDQNRLKYHNFNKTVITTKYKLNQERKLFNKQILPLLIFTTTTKIITTNMCIGEMTF
jgi:hypothetical protein